MTLEEKERKIKIIYLIMIVNAEYARRKPFKDVWETIMFGLQNVFWAQELYRLHATITFEKGGVKYHKGGLAMVVENKYPELINSK